MRTLPMPPQAAADVLATCVGGVADPALQHRLQAITPQLVAAAVNYDQLARVQNLHQVVRTVNVGAVTRSELEALYSQQMSAANGAARLIYSALRNASPNGKCPLCGIGTVTVLDHHLPKARYPNLSVCPFNLVPACDFCNNAKRARFPTCAEEQTIHPYYDDYTQQQWIFAQLDVAGPPVLVFYVNAPAQWPQVAQLRAKRHFDVVKLGVSYTSNANDDLIPLRDHLATIAATKGAAGVQAYLAEEQARYATRLNCWQHVMFQTLAANRWFVDGGYLQIPQ
ncbi:HNH endonuclease [Xanthobacter variabilis]|uniref:HNH endonuclease n=1 Tax=Xanthobacter variabilis TaxID=3119932 RepID=UPI00374E8E91